MDSTTGAEAQERASSPPPQLGTGTPPPQERTILPLKFVLSQEIISRKCHYFSDILLNKCFKRETMKYKEKYRVFFKLVPP